jgi:hypothetical protein
VRRDHGVVLGRPRSTSDDVVARVVRERTEGKTAYAIARDLNKDAVPTRRVAPPQPAPAHLLTQQSPTRRSYAYVNSKRQCG